MTSLSPCVSLARKTMHMLNVCTRRIHCECVHFPTLFLTLISVSIVVIAHKTSCKLWGVTMTSNFKMHTHEINSHEINSHEINSHQINFPRDQLPRGQLPRDQLPSDQLPTRPTPTRSTPTRSTPNKSYEM